MVSFLSLAVSTSTLSGPFGHSTAMRSEWTGGKLIIIIEYNTLLPYKEMAAKRIQAVQLGRYLTNILACG